MITNREEQLNEFFENGMSAADEQNFLISVAASDELRRAFRSQLELMKAVRSDKDRLRSVAQVRNRTFAALGLSATAAGQYFEHELLNGERAAAHKPLAAESLVANAPQAGMQWASRLGGRLLHTPVLSISAGVLFGIFSTIAIEHYENVPSNIVAPVPTAINSTSHVSNAETITSKNGLDNRGVEPLGKSVTNDRSAARHTASVAIHRAGVGEHPIASGSLIPAGKAAPGNVANTAQTPAIPEISKENPGMMQSQKITIIQKNDSTKATP